MSRTSIVVTVLLLLVAALGVGAAVALGVFANGDDGDPVVTEAAAEVPASIGAVTTLSPATSMPATTLGEDPLCAAHGELLTALDGHLPVEGPEDLQIVRTATLAFYSEAVGYVDPPEQDAFSEFVVYQQAAYDYSEAREWNPSAPIEDLLEDPPPPAPQEATAVVIQVLERCDVVFRVE